MADDEYSRSSAGDDDFDEPEEDNGIDNEGTLDEEEAFEEGDYSNELKDLEEEGEMDIEELRRRYNLPIADSDCNMPSEGCSSSYDDTGTVQNSLLADEEEGEEEEDKDYIPSDPYRKEIRVDEDLYQAQIPEIGSPEIEHPVAEPLWQPTDKLTDEEINSFVQKIVEIRGSLPVQVVPEQRYSLKRDDEDSLCALYRANYDVKKAEENYPFPRVNQPVRSVRPEALEWDSQEQQAFEDAFSQVGKDFNLIRQAGNLLYRPIGELIDYYYKWKKTDRYQKFKIEQIRKTADEEYRQFTEKMLSTSPPPAKKVYLDHPDHFNPHPQPGTP